jgi:transposase-like protein
LFRAPPTRPPYPPEFKEEAIRLMRSSEKPLAQISRELGVSEQTLRNWRKQEEIDEGEREGITTDEREGREELGRLKKRVRVLESRGERGPAKSADLLRQGGRDSVNLFRFIEAERAHYPVSLLCRVLRVSRSGYYACKERPPSKRSAQDAALTQKIREIHERSRRTYGYPRVHAELRTSGVECGRRRVARPDA